MRKIISISLLSVLLLSSCSIYWNDEKAKKISEQDTKISKLEKENDLFQKRKDCLNDRTKMLEFAKDSNPWVWKIDEVFYSNSFKSCFFIARETRNIDTNITRDFDLLYDYLWQKLISEVPLWNINWEYLDDWEFLKKVNGLKWE